MVSFSSLSFLKAVDLKSFLVKSNISVFLNFYEQISCFPEYGSYFLVSWHASIIFVENWAF